MNKTDKPTVPPAQEQPEPDEKNSEQAVWKRAITKARDDAAKLLTFCEPETALDVHRLLTEATDDQRMLLDAWARCGRSDYGRHMAVDLQRTARKTLSALGLACLVNYSRAWLDAADTEHMEMPPKRLQYPIGSETVGHRATDQPPAGAA